MKKYWKFAAIAAVLVAAVALIGASTIFAQGPANNNGADNTQMQNGRTTDRMNASQGSRGVGQMNETAVPQELMAVDEADIHAAIADVLGMSLDEFETAVAAGETPATLAAELGIAFAEVQAAMDAVHNDAFEQAVADGLISQEQADWILSHRGGAAGQSGGMSSGQSGSSHSNGDGTGDCMQ